NLYTVDVYLAPAALDLGKRRDAWIRWMLRLIDACPVLFGHGETRPEHDAKHLIDTGESESWVGSSLAELQRFLPGVYWLTVFGSALARELLIGTLSQRAGVTVHRTGAGDAVVVLDESAKPRDLAARLATERELAGLLGDAFFFDRERPDRDLRAVPGFVAELERAKGRT
ncbi:MAG TPA: hypothetical protein VLT45_21865, partial [Kofleriaceae bacterium]|nr:hypothetical protein [Kofleriaceae bacterium]